MKNLGAVAEPKDIVTLECLNETIAKTVGAETQSGLVAAVSVPANSYKDIPVTFPTAFSEAPTVQLTLYSGSVSGMLGRCVCAVLPDSVTTTGFTIRMFNGDESSSRAPAIYWTAIGKTAMDARSAITVYKSAAQTLTTSAAKVTMGSTLGSVGDAFTLSNGGVLVNRDCTAEISGNLYVNSSLTAKDLVYLQFWVNSTNICTANTDCAAYGVLSVPFTPIIRKLTKGSYLYLYAYNNTAARGNLPAYAQNRLTVREI